MVAFAIYKLNIIIIVIIIIIVTVVTFTIVMYRVMSRDIVTVSISTN